MIPIIKTDGGRIAAGFTNEKWDCSVRAVALAADVPYDVAHHALKLQGRKPRQGASTKQIKDALTIVAEKIEAKFVGVLVSYRFGNRNRIKYPTLTEVLRSHRTGRYIILTRNHAMALLDGQIHDVGEISGSRSRVQDIISVETKKQTKEVPAEQIIPQDQINELWARLDRLEARIR